jgi:hypothetical protein
MSDLIELIQMYRYVMVTNEVKFYSRHINSLQKAGMNVGYLTALHELQ